MRAEDVKLSSFGVKGLAGGSVKGLTWGLIMF